MGANRTVGALEAWLDHRLGGMSPAQLGSIVQMNGSTADVELEDEEGLIRYELPLVEVPGLVYEAGQRVLVVFTDSNRGGGVIAGKVSGG
ncbi:hypothetical protein [Paenibacillus agilis]|uniref:Uncharacterized protein n=1 Tax=Paenibacillus agilis TaxID=3020863 RepID=A0A559IVV2_9BACL|nr:hypothetical protein [Paenibacillus agilis]TVX91768.1 hypothetical protein FPZ44_01050 [Paenibacillus agilis]